MKNKLTIAVLLLFTGLAMGQTGVTYKSNFSERLMLYGTSFAERGYISVISSHLRFASVSGVDMHFHAGVGLATTAPLVLTSTGATITGALTVTGAFNQSGITKTSVVWATGGSVVLATAGNDVTPSNGARWWTEIQIPYNVTLTGIFYLIGTAGGTDSVVVDLYNNAGTLVASSYSGATGEADIVGSAANIQKVAFTSTYAAVAGKYFISLQFNGTTARFRGYTIPGSPFIAATAGGTYRTAATLTPGSSFTADKGPISGVY